MEMVKRYNPLDADQRYFAERSYTQLWNSPSLEVLLSEMRRESSKGEYFRQRGHMACMLIVAMLLDALNREWKVEEVMTKTGKGHALRYDGNAEVVLLLRASLLFLPALRALMGVKNKNIIFLDAKRRYRTDGSIYAEIIRGQIPDILDPNKLFLLFDPMGASCVSTIAAINECKKRGAQPGNFRIVTLFTVWNFFSELWKAFGHMNSHTGSINNRMNKKFYIEGQVIEPSWYPIGEIEEEEKEEYKINNALGDAGDRTMEGIEEESQWRKYYDIEDVELSPLL